MCLRLSYYMLYICHRHSYGGFNVTSADKHLVQTNIHNYDNMTIMWHSDHYEKASENIRHFNTFPEQGLVWWFIELRFSSGRWAIVFVALCTLD